MIILQYKNNSSVSQLCINSKLMETRKIKIERTLPVRLKIEVLIPQGSSRSQTETTATWTPDSGTAGQGCLYGGDGGGAATDSRVLAAAAAALRQHTQICISTKSCMELLCTCTSRTRRLDYLRTWAKWING